MPSRRIENSQQDSNTLLIDWVSGIYGVFWGIWLAQFSEEILTCKINTTSFIFDVLQHYYIVILISFGIWVTCFVYFWIRWLWSMRETSLFSPYGGILRRQLRILLIGFGAFCAIYWFSQICSLEVRLVWFGAGVILGWFLLINFIVLSDKRGWSN